MDARACVITAMTPPCVTKRFSVIKGRVEKTTSASVILGRMEIVSFAGLVGFAEVLRGLGPDQALTYGIPPTSPVDLVTEKAWAAAGRPAGQLPRTDKTMRWPEGPGVFELDYDPPAEGKPLDREAVVELLRTVCPGLAHAAMIWWSSAGSLIYRKGREVIGLRGQRLYILVADARDIPRAGKALTIYLWAAGYGSVVVSKSGSLLLRTPFDSSVWQSSRLDFAAGALCDPPLEQRRGEPVLIPGDVEVVDLRTAIPDPDAETVARARAAQVAAKAEKKGEAATVRAAWVAERAKEIDARAGENPAVPGRDLALRAVERGELVGDLSITVLEDGQRRNVTVLEVLDHPDRYHGALTLDPLEPDYDGGRGVGKLYIHGARPTLHSFAHGGQTFRLLRAPGRIELVRGREHDAVVAALDLMRQAPDLFDFGDEVVQVDDGRLYPLNEHSLRHYLGGLVQFWRWHKPPNGSAVEVQENPPASLCRAILAEGRRRRLKPLDAIITAPTLRPDGSVLATPGYDPETRLLLDLAEEVADVPSRPSSEQAGAALRTLFQPFKDFPFRGPVDRGVHLAAVVTAAVRPILPTAPGFGDDAPIQAAGKTLLAKCTGALATGTLPDLWPHTGGDDEEVRKRLFSALRSGCRALVWDNVVGTFDSAALAAALTAPTLVDRVLGCSEAASVPNRAIFIMTGNNLTLAGDLPRRVLVARIDPVTDRPFAREFDLDPLAHVVAHRQELVGAALTLVRAWLTSGAERAPGRMASFELWDDLVRQTVVWVGKNLDKSFGDPMEAVTVAQAADPEQESLGRLLKAWQQCFGVSLVSTKRVLNIYEAVQRAKKGSPYASATTIDASETELAEALDDFKPVRGELTTKSLGKALGYRKDRIVEGLRLVRPRQDRDGVWQWGVEPAGFGGFAGYVHPQTCSDVDDASETAEDLSRKPPTPRTELRDGYAEGVLQ